MERLTLAILGVSGGIGRRAATLALGRGHEVRGQTRAAAQVGELATRVTVVEGPPDDAGVLRRLVGGSDAVLYLLGQRTLRPTTFFSATTRALIAAMEAEHVRRLVVVTGVGAGETRGHGGFVYDRITFPLFTRRIYADKDRQEALVAASGLDWSIVRPAPFADTAPPGPLEVHAEVGPRTVLRRITRDEVARFVVDEAETGAHRGKRVFIGHP